MSYISPVLDRPEVSSSEYTSLKGKMKLTIKGIARPSGEIYSFEECRSRNPHLGSAVDDMRAFVEKFAEQEKLTGTVFICNTTGKDRDSCTIGFEYPKSKALEDRLNRAYTAKEAKEWAAGLAPTARKEFLRRAKKSPLAEWL